MPPRLSPAELTHLLQRGDLAGAEANAISVLAHEPRRADAWHVRGVVAYQSGRFLEAVGFLRQAVDFDQQNAFFRNNLGLGLQALGQFAEAAAEMRRAIELNPGVVGFIGNLANVLNHLEQYPAAEALARGALAIDPMHVDAFISLGAALSYQGRNEQAEACFLRAADLAPEQVEVRRNLAHIYQETGRFTAAEQEYEYCLQRDPTDGDAWFGLASTRKFTLEDEAIERRLNDALAMPTQTPHNLSDLHCALGKIKNDQGRYGEAFSHYAAAKQVPHEPFDFGEFRRRVDRWIEAFPPERFESVSPGASDSQLPVFIVGMPRSGSTLVEQILGAHPQIYPGGELTDLKAIMTGQFPALNAASLDPQTLEQIAPEQLRQWSQWYLARRRILAADAARVTDKMPINFMFLGLIALMFPRARIIHCRRQPLDCGLSIFMQRFVVRPDYSYSLKDIGRFYAEYERLMDHWRRVLPLTMIDVQYEELVERPEQTMRQLIDFVELPWDERCLRFHEQSRIVQTASSWQVRQPMHSGAVGRWRRYWQHLEPLVDGLNTEREQFNYEQLVAAAQSQPIIPTGLPVVATSAAPLNGR